MSHGVSKETYVEADDKTNRALTYDMLDTIHTDVQSILIKHEKHKEVCIRRFNDIEKKKSKLIAAWGFLGGFVAIVGTYITKWISK